MITSFHDLEVYRSAYDACLVVCLQLLPKLPEHEKYDLKDQLYRSTKAVPRLIAEGYGKRHQKSGFQKYIDDAIAEANETMVGIEQIKDIYKIQVELCIKLIDRYDKIGRQLYKLGAAWTNFKRNRPPLSPKRAS